MWLQDLEKALTKLKEECDYNFICVEKIMPCADGGIAFTLSNGDYVKWFPNGEIVRQKKDDWRTPSHPTPRLPSNNYVGGQMVRKLIETYEGRMKK